MVLHALNERNKRLQETVEKLQREKNEAQACHEKHLLLCTLTPLLRDQNRDLKAEVARLREKVKQCEEARQ